MPMIVLNNIFENLWYWFHNIFYALNPILYDQFGTYPFFLQLSLIFIVVSFITTSTSYFRLIIKRITGYYKERLKQKYQSTIEQLITEATVMNEDLLNGVGLNDIRLNKYVQEFAQILPIKHKKVRQLIIDAILHHKKNFSGEAGVLLNRLFIELNLHKDAINKLSAFYWQTKVKGLIELSHMEVSLPDVLILPLTNSKQRLLRMEARACYIGISKNEPFKFFDILTDSLTQWDQIDLFNIIASAPDLNIPNFSRWITYSDNNSLKSFCLKLAVYFNQQNAIPAIIELLKTKDQYLRAEAIESLGSLQADNIEKLLCDMYNNEPLSCQIAIIKTLGNIASGDNLQFLSIELQHNSDYDIKLNAARAITAHHSSTAKDLINELIKHTGGLTKNILQHALHPLITY